MLHARFVSGDWGKRASFMTFFPNTSKTRRVKVDMIARSKRETPNVPAAARGTSDCVVSRRAPGFRKRRKPPRLVKGVNEKQEQLKTELLFLFQFGEHSAFGNSGE